MSEKEYSIKETCKMLGLTEVYVRRMILKGKIKTRMVEIAKNTFKHLISETEIKRWRSSVGGTRREDGRGKFNIYCSQEELEKLNKILESNKLVLPLQKANLPKTKK